MSWVGFFEPNNLDASPSSRVEIMGLFLSTGVGLDGLVELVCKVLCTDSLVQ